MRKTIKNMFLGLTVLMLAEPLIYATNRFADKYPYGLLTDDFGILNESDLKKNTESSYPEPFDRSKLSNYAYWQCFPAQDVTVVCKGGFEIVAHDKSISHVYLPPHEIEAKDCREYQKNWRRLTQNEAYVCLSGPYTSFWKEEKEALWAFEKFKTKKGCYSKYFEDC